MKRSSVDEDYVGHEVHRAKRVSDAGHGEQVLVSQTTAELVAGKTPLKDLGSYWLKDLDEPQRIHQVGNGEFPSLRAAQAFRHNIPTQRTTFVGRHEECALVKKHLSDRRITTLTGVGGCGKTRLAHQGRRGGLERLPGRRVVRGPLEGDGSRRVDGLCRRRPRTCRRDRRPVDLRAESNRVLASDASLLVFDNCEHLIDACAELADELLASCPQLRILATSREALDVEGEQIYSIPSLDVPADGDETWGSVSVELFCDRAASVRPGFALTERERCCSGRDLPTPRRGSVGDRARCRADVAPLAGADRRAAERQVRPPHRRAPACAAAADARGDARLEPRSLVGPRTDAPPPLVGVPGTFALDAAEAVGGDDVGASTISTLRSLVAKSLVDTIEVDGAIRFRLLETVRLYAEEKLLGAGESESARTRHAGHFRGLVDGGVGAIFESGALTKFQLDEAHNLRAAIAWSHKTRRADDLAVLVVGSFLLWAGSLDEGVRWTEAALGAPRRDHRYQPHRVAAARRRMARGLSKPGGIRLRHTSATAIALAGPDPTPPVWVTIAPATSAARQSVARCRGRTSRRGSRSPRASRC